jgi:hypothetical protein
LPTATSPPAMAVVPARPVCFAYAPAMGPSLQPRLPLISSTSSSSSGGTPGCG